MEGESDEEICRRLACVDSSAEIIFLRPTLNADFGITMFAVGAVAEPSYISGAVCVAYYLGCICGLPLAEYEIETPTGTRKVMLNGDKTEINIKNCKYLFTKTAEMPDGSNMEYSKLYLDEPYAVARCELFPLRDKGGLGASLCRAANARAAVFLVPSGRIEVYTEAGYAPLADARAAAAVCLLGMLGGSGECKVSLGDDEVILSRRLLGISAVCSPHIVCRGEI